MKNVNLLVIFQNSLKSLRETLDIQCSSGNWNYDPYMLGMANGMIFALSLFDDKPPKYLEATKVWLCDINDEDVEVRKAINNYLKSKGGGNHDT